jgi:putative membrane protein
MTMMGIGFGMFGLLVMLLFWAGLVVLAAWLVRALFPHDGRHAAPAAGRGQDAREILNRRYARGEITREQYELMKQDLA